MLLLKYYVPLMSCTKIYDGLKHMPSSGYNTKQGNLIGFNKLN